MYLSQMGKVPLLTREGEVAICRRIEDAETEVKRILYGLGFAAKEHIALAEKLIAEPPKERFDRVILDARLPARERHLRTLRQLVKRVRMLDQKVDDKFADWQSARNKTVRIRLLARLRKLDQKLQSIWSASGTPGNDQRILSGHEHLRDVCDSRGVTRRRRGN